MRKNPSYMLLLRPTRLLISEKYATYTIIWSYTIIWQVRVVIWLHPYMFNLEKLSNLMIHLSWKQRRKKIMRKEKDTEKCVTTNLYFKSWVKKGIGERESRAVCNRSTSIIKKDGRNRKRTIGWDQYKINHIAGTYLQPHYGNGGFGNVYLSAGQHYEVNIAGTPVL
jgi:hypothetical protein